MAGRKRREPDDIKRILEEIRKESRKRTKEAIQERKRWEKAFPLETPAHDLKPRKPYAYISPVEKRVERLLNEDVNDPHLTERLIKQELRRKDLAPIDHSMLKQILQSPDRLEVWRKRLPLHLASLQRIAEYIREGGIPESWTEKEQLPFPVFWENQISHEDEVTHGVNEYRRAVEDLIVHADIIRSGIGAPYLSPVSERTSRERTSPSRSALIVAQGPEMSDGTHLLRTFVETAFILLVIVEGRKGAPKLVRCQRRFGHYGERTCNRIFFCKKGREYCSDACRQSEFARRKVRQRR